MKNSLTGIKIISNILRIFSLAAVIFIFQSCEPAFPDALVRGKVTSSSNNQGIKGIKVSAGYYDYGDSTVWVSGYAGNFAFTDNNGEFSFHIDLDDAPEDIKHYNNDIFFRYKIFFEDIDSSENGLYERKVVQIEGADLVDINVTLKEIL